MSTGVAPSGRAEGGMRRPGRRCWSPGAGVRAGVRACVVGSRRTSRVVPIRLPVHGSSSTNIPGSRPSRTPRPRSSAWRVDYNTTLPVPVPRYGYASCRQLCPSPCCRAADAARAAGGSRRSPADLIAVWLAWRRSARTSVAYRRLAEPKVFKRPPSRRWPAVIATGRGMDDQRFRRGQLYRSGPDRPPFTVPNPTPANQTGKMSSLTIASISAARPDSMRASRTNLLTDSKRARGSSIPATNLSARSDTPTKLLCRG
jgi:hypothetical protein